MKIIPCPICGYHAPAQTCPHCDRRSDEPSLQTRSRGSVQGLTAGLQAIPQGFFLLLSNSGVKRFLVPPFLLTLLVASAVTYWLWGFVDPFFDALVTKDPNALGLEDGWIKDVITWTMSVPFLLWMAEFSRPVLVFVLFSGMTTLTILIGYEALAGPFLDEVQGRLEKRWFGTNPRDNIERPTDIPVSKCVRYTLLASLVATALGAWVWVGLGAGIWYSLLALVLPFLAFSLIFREYGKWLGWVIRVESGTLLVSLKAAALALMILVAFLWLHLIPVVGTWLWLLISGFTVALSMLDIPFSRRQWSLKQRLDFLLANFLAIASFGVVASLLAGLVPIVGALLMVPTASVGGVWLVCRLDKESMRPIGGPPPSVASAPRS